MVTSDIANQFFADIARYIENIAHNYNYTVLFGSSDENAEKLDNIVDTFIGNGVEGLIVAPCSGSEGGAPQGARRRHSHRAARPRHRGTRRRARDAGQRAGRADGRGTPLRERLPPYRDDSPTYAGHFEPFERERGATARPCAATDWRAIRRSTTRSTAMRRSDTVRIFEDRRAAGVEAFLLPTNTLALLGLQALNALNLSAPEDLALVGFDESEIFLALQTFWSPHHQSTRRLGEQSFEMLRRMIAGDDDCRSVVIEPKLIVGGSTACIHPRNGSRRAGTCCGRRGADAARLRTAPGNLFPAQGRLLDGRSPSSWSRWGRATSLDTVWVRRSDAVTKIEIPQSGQYRIFVRTKNWTAHWAAEKMPRRLPPPHRRPRLRHALRYGRSRMALAGGRYDLLYGGRPPSRAARSGGIRRALRRHPLHAARRGARRFARNGLPAAQQPARPARRTRRAGDVRFRRRGRRRGRHVPPLRRHGKGCAWR